MDFQEKLRSYKIDPNPQILEELKAEARRHGPGGDIALLYDLGFYRFKSRKHPKEEAYRIIIFSLNEEYQEEFMDYLRDYYGDIVYRYNQDINYPLQPVAGRNLAIIHSDLLITKEDNLLIKLLTVYPKAKPYKKSFMLSDMDIGNIKDPILSAYIESLEN